MQLTTDGLIIRVRNIGDKDRLCTVLTRKCGIINAFAKGANTIKHKNASATGLFTYAQFEIYKRRDTYIIDEAEPKELFFDVRNGLEKLSLAQYFCELAAVLCTQESEEEDSLRLLLNALDFIAKEKLPLAQIKAIFEMRMMLLHGYMPDLIMCNRCGSYEAQAMYLLTQKGILLCSACGISSGDTYAVLDPGAVHAMRHIIYADFSRIFFFTLTDRSLEQLARASEKYVTEQLQRDFTTLNFYKQLF